MIAEKFWTTLAHTPTHAGHNSIRCFPFTWLKSGARFAGFAWFGNEVGWHIGPGLSFFVGIEDTFGWTQVVFIPFSFSLLWSHRNPAGVENHNLMMWFVELEKKGPTTERGKNTRFMLRLRLVCRSLPIFLPRHNMSIRWWDFWQWPWSLSITFSSSTFPPPDGWPHSKSRMESIFLASESSTKEGESSSKI